MNVASFPFCLESVLKVGRLICILLSLNFLTLIIRAQSNNPALYTWTTLAGYPPEGSADGVGDQAQFSGPHDVAADTSGNVFVIDTLNCTIREVTPAGVVSTIAGFPGSPGSADGVGSKARFDDPEGIAVDTNENLYVADTYNNTIRKIVPAITANQTNWVVSTLAGAAGIYGGDADGIGTNAQFSYPDGVAVDSAGNIYVADGNNSLIREITPAGVVSTIAQIVAPNGITVGGTNIYVTDLYYNHGGGIRRIRPVGTNWEVTTIAQHLADPGPYGRGPYGVAADNRGNVFASYDADITEITPLGTNWQQSTLAGGSAGYADGTGTNAQFAGPSGMTWDSSGIYVADDFNNNIRLVTLAGVVTTVAGSMGIAGSADGTAGEARFSGPAGIAVDSAGIVYVADSGNDTIRKITPAGVVSTLAGLAGSPGTNDGIGNDARFSSPESVAVDNDDNVYVADTANDTIRKITPAGVVSTLAGLTTSPGTNDGVGSNARFDSPSGVAVDNDDNVYVADLGNDTIRKITSAGVVSTIAGFPGSPGSADGVGNQARFNYPQGVAVDNAGNVYVADGGDIRKVTPVVSGGQTNWVVSTLGAWTAEYDDVAVDGEGNLYVADPADNIIQKITSVGTNWVASIIGGPLTGLGRYFPGSTGSTDGAGSAARFNGPSGIAVDSAGNVYVADTFNNTIRKGVFSAYGSAKPVAYTPPGMRASLTVTLQPPEASGQWRFPWEVAWHNSGESESNLTAGSYPLEFKNIPGWLTIPLSDPVILTNGESASITNQYYPTLGTVDTNNGGALTVTLGVNPPSGAAWGFLGQGAPAFSSGFATNLVAGTYLITFAPVSGRVTPPNLSVQIQAGQPTYVDENYPLSQATNSTVYYPFPVPSSSITDETDYPFGFNGQLETDVGYGSGVAVQTNVVLTAAHLVFNDQTESYVSHAYWFFQQEKGVSEPDPLEARGWYVLSGYASARTNDLLSGFYSPGQSSPQSRNFDVAVLYFEQPVAGGGYGGYLPSDASPNTWLTSTSLKMLVGYPVDGSLFGDASIVPGTMYQTDPQPYPLTLATDPVADQQVYLANWLLSYAGNSGGPLYVQYNGYYYPAGVYLGTLFNGTVPYASLVRGIDRNVVDMITLAQSLGDSGTNNTGGGVITIIPNQAISANNPGYIQFQLQPSAAVQAGAAWRLQGQPSYSTATNYTVAVTTTNAVVVQFKAIAGWNLPTNQTVTVLPGQLTAYSAFYMVTNPVLVAKAVLGIGITGTMGTVYQIQTRGSLATGMWVPVSTNTIVSNGFNLILPLPASLNQTSAFYRAVWLP